MAEFLTTSAVAHHIETIIMEAKTELVLVSPYLQLSPIFSERLKDAAGKGVLITLLCRKNELKPDQMEILRQLAKLELYYIENLHAKCYFNESKMVITSMNMYAYSEKINREMGVLIDCHDDLSLFKNAIEEVQSIKRSGKRETMTKETFIIQTPNNGQTHFGPMDDGYCIRCADEVEFDPFEPLCDECYDEWAEWRRPEYKENFCHACGRHEHTCKAFPQCAGCYAKWNAKRG